ncbi:MAG: hypothetical protein GXO92_01600 [FCB group bacterium]|nr:hypothetical protein [FCB group bacterium]
MKILRSIGYSILLLFIPFRPVAAQLSSFDINGYAKYLYSTAKYPFADEQLNDQLLHTRINTRWYPSQTLMAALEIRFRGFYGESVEKMPNFKKQIKSRHEYAQLDNFLWDTKKSVGYAQVDRLWLDYSRGNLETTIGRQRIAWGTAFVWNVIDLFNPQSILDFDYEEKPGADAVRIQYYTGAVSKAELSVRPGKNKNTITAGLLSVNAWGYDFYGIAGVRKQRWVVGGAWAGDVHKAGFRGEFLISAAPDKNAPEIIPDLSWYGTSFFEYDKPTISAVISADYTFPNSVYIHTEVLYNSIGKTKNAGAFYMEALQADLLSPARWSLFQELAYDLTPLIRIDLFGIFNPDDKSSIIAPYLTWSIKTDLDLALIGFLSSGKQYTEYGDYGNSAFIRVTYSF